MAAEYKYLIMVTGDTNHNKFYEMVPNGSSFDVHYGRVGATCQDTSYDVNQFEKKYREKIKKGYKDVTDLHKKVATVDWVKEKDPLVQDLVTFLHSVARQVIDNNYESSDNITPEMVDAAQTVLTNASNMVTVADINTALSKLFEMLPRKMSEVSDYLVNDPTDIKKVLEREQNLLDTMKGQVATNIATKKVIDSGKQTTLLGAFDTAIRVATDDEKENVKSYLGSYSSKLHQVYAVCNKNTEAKFNAWTGNSKKTDLLWHGSRTENWLSIAATGLLLSPNAVTTGKMFGYGIYFATDPSKSSGYTNITGSRWANGQGGRAFMGLFEVHTGNSKTAYNFDSEYHLYNKERLAASGKYDSLWASAKKGMLHADEIIVYDESQATIRYLVELD